jgi:hypothetical protein
MDSEPKKPLTVGEVYFVPFWAVQQHLDASVPDPFIKCKLLRLYSVDAVNPDTMTPEFPVDACKVSIYYNAEHPIVIEDLPSGLLVRREEVSETGDKIAEWFASYEATED